MGAVTRVWLSLKPTRRPMLADVNGKAAAARVCVLMEIATLAICTNVGIL